MSRFLLFMKKILDRFKIFYEHLDSELQLHPANPLFWDYLTIPMPDKPVPVTDIFYELTGYEEDLSTLIRDGRGELEIPVINRKGRDGLIYFNLTVLTSSEDVSPAFIVVEDETRVMVAQQEISQSNNEIVLLKLNLEKRNLDLVSANAQLDTMGKDLAGKNTELNKLVNIVRVQNHDLESKVRIRTNELWDSRLEIIKRLALAAEYRDPDTGRHIFRMSRSCVLIGKEYGMCGKECDLLLHATPLHDIGKIGTPDAILLKPSGLSGNEWKIMKRHTTIGSEMLEGSSFPLMEMGRTIALRHHERWDGTGYPDGLKGEKIPLPSRITAVADVFDALTSKRPYKKPWSIDRAVEEIKKDSGSAFDPSIVGSFLDILDDIVKLRKQAGVLSELVTEL
jgi:HD-GYP domain-containing protein (c-di-GMP phosphodiesterase class II)